MPLLTSLKKEDTSISMAKDAKVDGRNRKLKLTIKK
jgi:hypothetical protein